MASRRHRARLFRQHDRQLVLWYRNVTAGIAVHDRDRAAPVTLAADAPVAQAELGAGLTQAFGGQGRFHGVECSLEVQTVEFAGIDQEAVFVISRLPRSRCLVASAAHAEYSRSVCAALFTCKKYVCTCSSLRIKKCRMLFNNKSVTKRYHEKYTKDTAKCDQR